MLSSIQMYGSRTKIDCILLYLMKCKQSSNNLIVNLTIITKLVKYPAKVQVKL